MAVPALLLFGLFALLPMLIVIVLSFTKWDGLGSISWAGTHNWTKVFSGSVTRHALWLTLKVMVISWVIQTPISLLLGVFTAGKQRYRAVFAAIYFVPLLLSSAAVALAYRNLLDPNFGLPQSLKGTPLSFLNQDWLGNQNLVLVTVLFVISWQFVPFHSLLYQAGVRQIPHTMYEAAAIDGASTVQQFFSITLPQLRYTIITSTTLMLVGSLTYFDVVFIMTGGGPGFATRLLPLDMYITGFQSHDFGSASAIAVVLVVAGLLLSLGLVKFSGFSRMESQTAGA
jgi:raffinose/stachyose/melibiose transport system permease protein